jgi:hypothetical protein
MFLREKIRKKDGKKHRYISVVENRRVASGRVVQRHLLSLGEINDSQELAWRRSIEVFEDGAVQPRTLSLFPADRCDGLLLDSSIIRLKLSHLRLCRPRQWGACWLVLTLWRELQLDLFWTERLAVSRQGTRWDQVLLVLVAYRLIAPGSEWRLHREWFERSALADLLVPRVIHITGYSRFSFVRALAVVNCQSALVWFLLRQSCQAATSSIKVCLSGIRRSRHCGPAPVPWTGESLGLCYLTGLHFVLLFPTIL